MRNMNLFKKVAYPFAALALTVALLPSAPAQAAEGVKTYTVTYRPGNVGVFALDKAAVEDETTSTKVDAEAVAATLYGNYDYEVTELGAIKVTVEKGETTPSSPANYVVANDGYFVKRDFTGGKAADTVTKKVDYVIDYGRLTDAVTYTVYYVDDQSGEQVAPPSVQNGNNGTEIEVTAPATLTTSDAGFYALSGNATQKITLDKTGTNEITFRYTYTYDPGTITETTTTTVDGGTVVINENNPVYVAGAGGNVAVAGAGGAGAGGDAGAAEQGGEEVVIEDAETPLADGGNNGGDTTDIPDEETPLAANTANTGINATVIIAGVMVALALALAITWLVVKKKQSLAGAEDNNNK